MGEYNLLLPKDMLQLIFEAAVIYHETNHECGPAIEEQYVTISVNQLEELLLFEAGEWIGVAPPSVTELMSREVTMDLNLPEQFFEPQMNQADLRMTQEEMYMMLRQNEMEELSGRPITEPDQWIQERRKMHPLRETSSSEVTFEQVEAALLAALAESAPLQDVTQLDSQSECPRNTCKVSILPPDLSYLERPSVTPRNLVSPEHAQRMLESRLKHEASPTQTTLPSECPKIPTPDNQSLPKGWERPSVTPRGMGEKIVRSLEMKLKSRRKPE